MINLNSSRPAALRRRAMTPFLAALAGLLLQTAASDARAAQTACPTNGPEVAFYSVTASTEPERTFEMPLREATVVGGDAVQGQVRIFLRFAEPLSTSCSADVYLWRHPSRTSFGTPRENDADPRAYFQDLFPEAAAKAFQLRGEGDDTKVLTIATNPYISPSPRLKRHDAWFSIGHDGPRHPFFVNQRSSTLDLRAAAASTVGRTGVVVTAVSSIQLHPAVEFPVEFSVVPPYAGGFTVGSSHRPTVTGPLDPGIAPSRVNATFSALPPATPTLVTVVARTKIPDPVYVGGRTAEERSVSITVEPEAQPCRVEARVAARPGGLEVVVLNTGTVLCSDLKVLTMISGQARREIVAGLAPGRDARFRYVLAPIPLSPPSRMDASRDFGRVSVYLESKGGSPYPIGNYQFTRADVLLLNTR